TFTDLLNELEVRPLLARPLLTDMWIRFLRARGLTRRRRLAATMEGGDAVDEVQLFQDSGVVLVDTLLLDLLPLDRVALRNRFGNRIADRRRLAIVRFAHSTSPRRV